MRMLRWAQYGWGWNVRGLLIKGLIDVSGKIAEKLYSREKHTWAPGQRLLILDSWSLEIIALSQAIQRFYVMNIYIGSNSFISWECMISDTDFHKIKSISDGTCLNDNKPVHIGEHVWIGARCTVLKGSRIPDDSVLAAGSIVTKKLKSNNAIYVSNNIVKGDITWEA